MTDEFPFPPQLICFGEAMRPVLEKIEQQIHRPIQPYAAVIDMSDLIMEHLQSLQRFLQRIADRVDRLNAGVIANEAATDAEVYRAVGGFEAIVDDVLADYRKVRSLNAQGHDMEARNLLSGVYRHTLCELRDWMRDLVDTLADPMTTLVSRGLPTSGHVELTFELKLTAAAELASLTYWLQKHGNRYFTGASLLSNRSSPQSGLGIWGYVGAAILGHWLGSHSGNDDCA